MNSQQKQYIIDNLNKKSVAAIAGEIGLKEREVRRFIETVRTPHQKEPPRTSGVLERYRTDKRIPLALLLIMLIGIAAYVTAVNGSFVYDDERLVKNNLYIKKWENLPKIFTEDIGAGAGSIYNYYNFYRPLQMLTYMVDYTLWGMDPRGFHITSIALHVGVAIALFFLILLLFDNVALGFWTSALFVVHPLHTEAVAYIAGRADILCALGIFLTLIGYIRYTNEKRTKYLILTIAAYSAACLSKEYALITPCLLPLCHYVMRRRAVAAAPIAIGVVTVIYMFLRMTVFNFPVPGTPETAPLVARIPGFFVALGRYAQLIVAPFGLHMEYGTPVFSFTNPYAIAGMLLAGALIATIVIAIRKKVYPLAVFALGWFAVSIIPVSNLYPINAYMAEHWLYVPSVGLFLLAASGITTVLRRERLHIAGIALGTVLVLAYGSMTVVQNSYWKDSVTFYTRTLAYSPNNVRLHSNLGTELMSQGKNEAAIEEFKKAIATRQSPAGAYNNLGIAYANCGRHAEAVEAYKKAVELSPGFAEVYNNLGVSYVSLGNKAAAVAAYKKAIELNPYYADAYSNFGSECDDPREAVAAYTKAVEINPRHATAYYNLSRAYTKLGDTEKAARAYQRAKELDPHLP